MNEPLAEFDDGVDPGELEVLSRGLKKTLGIDAGMAGMEDPELQMTLKKPQTGDGSRESAGPGELCISPVTDPGSLEFCLSWLWSTYSQDPRNPAFNYRAYASREELVQDWVAGGVLLSLADRSGVSLALGVLGGADSRRENAWLKYMLRPDLKGMPGAGLNALAAREFAKFAYERYGLKRLYTLVPGKARAVADILKNMGWTREGTLSGYGRFQLEPVDGLIYALALDDEGLRSLFKPAGGGEGRDDGGERTDS
jgi:RimJ/RimL family protein N-acetyltransferase